MVFYGFLGDLHPRPIYGPDLEEAIEDSAFSHLFAWSKVEKPRAHTVEPYPILEPLKVRMITKPRQLQYLGHKAIQQLAWESLQNFYQDFRPIGEMYGDFMVPQTLKAWAPGKKFVSGDYSAATDRLPSEVSACLRPLLCDYFIERIATKSKILLGDTMTDGLSLAVALKNSEGKGLMESELMYTSAFFHQQSLEACERGELALAASIEQANWKLGSLPCSGNAG
jgi:hypothetical protein